MDLDEHARKLAEGLRIVNERSGTIHGSLKRSGFFPNRREQPAFTKEDLLARIKDVKRDIAGLEEQRKKKKKRKRSSNVNINVDDIQANLETQSMSKFLSAKKKTKFVEGTSLEETEARQHNRELPVCIENEPLEKLRRMVQAQSDLVGIELRNTERTDNVHWHINGITKDGGLPFRASFKVNETNWSIEGLEVSVPRHVQAELAPLLDSVRQTKCFRSFAMTLAHYGTLYEARRKLFQSAQAEYPGHVEIHIDPVKTGLSDDPSMDVGTLQHASTEMTINKRVRIRWFATFPATTSTLEPHLELSLLESDDQETLAGENPQRHFTQLVRQRGIAGATSTILRISCPATRS